MNTSSETLDGKWGLITGAAKRIGASIARKLHGEGANIAVHFRDSEAPAQGLADELNSARSGSAFAIRADLMESSALPAMIGTIIEKTGRLDFLINNASSFYPTPIGSITEDQWDDLIGTNLKAPLFLSQAAIPYLREARGSIINIVDIHSERPLRNHTIYGPAKAGLAMLTRSLARDLAPEIRVNGVSPGAILWPEDGMPERVKESVLNHTDETRRRTGRHRGLHPLPHPRRALYHRSGDRRRRRPEHRLVEPTKPLNPVPATVESSQMFSHRQTGQRML
jgi:pteridine reductase